MFEGRRPLLNHQIPALAWAVQKDRLPLYMQMRLGKSLVAIRWAEWHISQQRKAGVPSERCRVLVLTVPWAMPDWMLELKKEMVPARAITSERPRVERTAQARENAIEWKVMSYDTLRATPGIADQQWMIVIADESTAIRNPKAAITKLIMGSRLVEAPFKACLSGCPNPESDLDFVSQFLFLYGEYVGCRNYWQFLRRNYVQFPGTYEWILRPKNRARIDEWRSARAFFMDRKAVGVGSSKSRESAHVPLSAPQRKLIRELYSQYMVSGSKVVSDEKAFRTTWRIAIAVAEARIAGGYRPDAAVVVSTEKIERLLELLRTSLREEKKIVVWFRFNHEMELVDRALRSAGWYVERIVGEVKPKDRSAVLERWRTSEKKAALLAQIRCATRGVDCSVADTAIYYSSTFEAELRMQSEDRLISPTKTSPVLIVDLISENTIDEDIWKQTSVEKRIKVEEVFASWIERNYKLIDPSFVAPS